MNARILVGDARLRLSELPDASVQTCVTSPPYFGLRDYGHSDQMGLETTPDEYVKEMVGLFREVRRVLKDNGTLWLNLGDSYATSGASGTQGSTGDRAGRTFTASGMQGRGDVAPKNLLGIPWRVAFALQADGWYLRQDIIWAKPNPMPESVRDRCTKSHEYLFLLSKNARYYYDADTIAEPAVATNFHDHTGSAYFSPGQTPQTGSRNMPRFGGSKYGDSNDSAHATKSGNEYTFTGLRNKRDVWTIPTKPFKGAHFAVMPEALVEPCVLAGSREGDVVLDPFAGSGTVGVVALRHQREFIGVELNPEYAQMARARIEADAPMLNHVEIQERP